jgi:hypothetical protein
MAVTNDQIRSVAQTGAKAIELQLSMADTDAWEAFNRIWPFAYCYGAFEALARHFQMDTVEAYVLITVGFEELLLKREGKKKLERAFELQANKFFVEGRAHGFDDFSRWMTEKGFCPLMLANFFVLGKPAPLAD